jgi:glycosyltransferase involved in cell wall biosynthesis
MADDAALHRVLGRCHRIVAPSEWMRRRLIADGLDGDRIEVVHPPISEPTGPSRRQPGDDAPSVLFAGRLVDIKGVDQLLAASLLCREPHQLWIAGEGPARPALEAQARASGIADRCRFFGNLGPEELGQRQAACDVAVVPTLAPENFAMVAGEAMIAGRPVVAFDVGGNSEWCRDGETGLLVPVGDVAALAAAIDRLLGDAELRGHLGANGRALAQSWVPAEHAARMVGVYRAAAPLARAGGRPG